MNWTSLGGGHELDESGLADERLDALQARLEVLERDRDSRLRDAATDIRERKARMRELEDERNAALRVSIESRVRFESAQRELDDLREQKKMLEASLADARKTFQQLDGVRAAELKQLDQARAAEAAAAAEARQLGARAEAQVVALLEERTTIGEFVNRAAQSRAWRVGHRFTSLGRLLTFRRSRGTSALGQLQTRLERAPLELPSPKVSASTDVAPASLESGLAN